MTSRWSGLRAPAPVPVIGAVLAVTEAALLGWMFVTGRVFVFALLQFLVVPLAAGAATVVRYRRFRRAYEEQIARAAVAADRLRLAEEVHDVLGHELSVIALQAAALQMRSTGEVRERAAALRRDVEHAVLRLGEAVGLLRAGGPGVPADTPPATQTTAELVARAAASGVVVDVVGRQPEGLPGPIERTVHGIVREGLTNATRHAPGAPVTVTFAPAPAPDGDRLEVRVENPVPRPAERQVPPARRPGTGLATLGRRVTTLGGTLTAGTEDGRHRLVARLPVSGSAVSGSAVSGSATSGSAVSGSAASRSAAGAWAPVPDAGTAPRIRRPLLATVGSVLVPGAVAAAALFAFWLWATLGSTLEDGAFAGLHLGRAEAAVRPGLPGRQAPVHLLRARPHPAGWRCAYYTDGNVPLGMATFEVCFGSGSVVRLTDLRREDPW